MINAGPRNVLQSLLCIAWHEKESSQHLLTNAVVLPRLGVSPRQESQGSGLLKTKNGCGTQTVVFFFPRSHERTAISDYLLGCIL